MPKFNMYQSLHTTVIGPEGKPVELQIRTFDDAPDGRVRHRGALEVQGGPAAARRRGKGRPAGANDMAWLRQLLDWQRETDDPGEFLESLRFDLEPAEVFVFTPKGDVIALPQGATPVDFAYAVHTEVGHRCVGARVNGRLVPLESALDNGDVVEVFTSKAQGAGPSPRLADLRQERRARATRSAPGSPRSAARRPIEQGKDALARAMRKQGLPLQRLRLRRRAARRSPRELRYPDISALYAAIGESHVSAQSVVQRLVESLGGDEGADRGPRRGHGADPRGARKRRRAAAATRASSSRARRDVWVKLAKCCTPVPGDPIVGFVTRGSGVSVHRTDCANVAVAARSSRTAWSRSSGRRRRRRCSSSRSRSRRSTGRGCCPTSPGCCPTSTSTSCRRRSRTTRDRIALSRFTFEMADPTHLGHVLRAVRGVDGVFDAYRITSGSG